MEKMTLLRRRVTELALTLLLLTAGCGDEGLSGAQRAGLEARVDQARDAAEARDADGVRRALVAFRSSVRAARGGVSE